MLGGLVRQLSAKSIDLDRNRQLIAVKKNFVRRLRTEQRCPAQEVLLNFSFR